MSLAELNIALISLHEGTPAPRLLAVTDGHGTVLAFAVFEYAVRLLMGAVRSTRQRADLADLVPLTIRRQISLSSGYIQTSKAHIQRQSLNLSTFLDFFLQFL